jgi:hypothetical protein
LVRQNVREEQETLEASAEVSDVVAKTDQSLPLPPTKNCFAGVVLPNV